MKDKVHSPLLSEGQNEPGGNKSGRKILTMLQAYNARLIEVDIHVLQNHPQAEMDLIKSVGEIVLIKEVIRLNEQVILPIVRQVNNHLQVLHNWIVVEAMKELGCEVSTVVVLDCSDDDMAQSIMRSHELLKFSPDDISYQIKLNKFQEVKAAIKSGRDKAIKEGIPDVPHTNEILSEVLGENPAYVKQLAKIAESPDRDNVATELDAGKSIHEAVSNRNNKGLKAPKEPKPCQAGIDTEGMCADCPGYQSFMDELRRRQDIFNSKTKE